MVSVTAGDDVLRVEVPFVLGLTTRQSDDAGAWGLTGPPSSGDLDAHQPPPRVGGRYILICDEPMNSTPSNSTN